MNFQNTHFLHFLTTPRTLPDFPTRFTITIPTVTRMNEKKKNIYIERGFERNNPYPTITFPTEKPHLPRPPKAYPLIGSSSSFDPPEKEIKPPHWTAASREREREREPEALAQEEKLDTGRRERSVYFLSPRNSRAIASLASE